MTFKFDVLHAYARDGDTVIVTAIDRLGRSVAEVTRTIAELGERRILLRTLREGIDTGTPTGRAIAAIMATLAELELELGRERRAAARASRRSRQLPTTKPASSAPSARTNCAGWPPPANQCESWLSPLRLADQPPTGICRRDERSATFR